MEVAVTIEAVGRPGPVIRDRYEPLCLFDLMPQLQLRFEPKPAMLD
jgi:hypothetical protein